MAKRTDKGPAEEPLDWHRFFGLILSDLFTNSPFVVDLEKDLSLKKQLLDVVILRKGEGEFAGRLPDGLEDLAAHNLISFKSYQEALDDWALKELTGHYVNYRKQVSPSMQQLLPEDLFRLYAVCARYPRDLAGQVPWEEVQTGVYQVQRRTDVIRVLVLRQLPQAEHNAPLQLLSADPEQFRYAADPYQQHSPDTSTLIGRLLEKYKGEGLPMPYTMEDFRRDSAKKYLPHLTPQERVEGLTPQERVEGLPLEQQLEKVSLEEIENYVKRRKEAPSSAAEGGTNGQEPAGEGGSSSSSK
ncbi:MAG: hypothetical protein L0Z62_51065 [Gemmataceae bacterium]|nr:hypothetical protein [Gemmataceae bacterium]